MADNTKAITKPENLAWGLWTHDEVELIRDTYFPKATVNELRLFLTLAAKRGLEPGIQLIAVKFKTQDGGERVTFITPIDGYRSLADRTGNYAGSDEYLFDDGLTEYQHIVSTKEKPITATENDWLETFCAGFLRGWYFPLKRCVKQRQAEPIFG